MTRVVEISGSFSGLQVNRPRGRLGEPRVVVSLWPRRGPPLDAMPPLSRSNSFVDIDYTLRRQFNKREFR